MTKDRWLFQCSIGQVYRHSGVQTLTLGYIQYAIDHSQPFCILTQRMSTHLGTRFLDGTSCSNVLAGADRRTPFARTNTSEKVTHLCWLSGHSILRCGRKSFLFTCGTDLNSLCLAVFNELLDIIHHRHDNSIVHVFKTREHTVVMSSVCYQGLTPFSHWRDFGRE